MRRNRGHKDGIDQNARVSVHHVTTPYTVVGLQSPRHVQQKVDKSRRRRRRRRRRHSHKRTALSRGSMRRCRGTTTTLAPGRSVGKAVWMKGRRRRRCIGRAVTIRYYLKRGFVGMVVNGRRLFVRQCLGLIVVDSTVHTVSMRANKTWRS
jgi:hypothetical protein